MGYGAAVLYLFTTSVHSGVLGALITLAGSVWYPSYVGLTSSWGLTPLEDQQLGGLIMWIPAGLVYVIAGLALFARAPVDGSFVVDVLPGMLLLGLGAGMAFNPVLLAAMNDARSDESGLASGIVNTSFMMGGALGLAVLASLADARTNTLQAGGVELVAALNRGYQLAFLLAALATAAAALISGVMMRPKARPEEPETVAETV